MAVIYVPSSIEGQSYSVRIAGDTPTPQEQANINAYVARMDARRGPAAAPVEDDEPSMLGGVGSGLGRGFFGSLAAVPGGIGSLVDAGYGKLTGQPIEPGGTAFGGVMRDISEGAAEGVESMFGPSTDSTAGKIAEAVGSIGSFIVPGSAVGTGLRLAGAGARTALMGAGAAGAGMGAALGADQQAQEIGDAILSGDVIDPAAQQSAVLWGGLIGSTEAVAGGAVARGIGLTYKILNKVPPAAREEALAKLSGRIASAIRTGGIEGAQEALSQIAQNIVSREYYDPERDITEGSGEALGVGGAAGAIIDLALTSARAPAIKRSIQAKQVAESERAAKELEEDLISDQESVTQRIQFGDQAEEAARPLILTPEMRVREEEAAAGRVPPLPLTQEMRVRDEEAAEGRQPPLVLTQGMRDREIETADGRQPPLVLSPEMRLPDTLKLTQEMRAREDEAGAGRLPPLQLTPEMRVPDDTPPPGSGPTGAPPAGTAPTTGTAPTPTRPNYKRVGEVLSAARAQKAAGKEQIISKAGTKVLVDAGLLAETDTEVPAIAQARVAEILALGPKEVRARLDAVSARRPPAQAPSAAPSAGIEIDGIDDIITNGVGNVVVKEGGKKVPFDKFALSIDGRTAEVGFVEKSKKARKGIGYDAYVALGESLAQRGITLQSTETKYGPGQKLWQRLEANGYAKMNPTTKRQEFTPKTTPAPAQVSKAQTRQTATQAASAPRKPSYTAKEQQLMAALRQRFNAMNLPDVELVTQRVVRPKDVPEGTLIEGMMDVKDGNRVIALAMSVYDPAMSDKELFDAIAEVMDHEVVHAMRNLGLFMDTEWEALTNLATRQQYMKLKGGKVAQRNYTYLQRAQQMYADSSPEIQVEEAVAEMFRDYVAGRLKIGGRPRSLMERIKGFFKSIWGAHEATGLANPNEIFEGIRLGDIGKRTRKPMPVDEDMVRTSRRAAEVAPQDPNFRKWASGPNGEKVIADASGKPVIYYTGTSKDQDFTKFNVSRHGGWFTTDPESASSYALQNDSMGYKRDGWSYTQTNTASRVMPVFLRAANPYRGPLPASALAENYKKAQSDWFDSLRRQGHDAWVPDDQPGLMVVLKDSQQIKSVFARGEGGKGDMRRYSKLTFPGGENVANLSLARVVRDARREEDATTKKVEDLFSNMDKISLGKATAYERAKSSGVFDNFQIGDKFIRANNKYAQPMTIIDHVMRPVKGWKDIPPESVIDGHFPQVMLQTSLGEQTVALSDLGRTDLYTKIAGKPRLVSDAGSTRFSALSAGQQAGDIDGEQGLGRGATGADAALEGTGRAVGQPTSEAIAPRATDGSPVLGGLTPYDLANLTEEFFTKPGWAILTATAEGNTPVKNEMMHARLVDELNRMGIPFRRVEGMYQGVPDGISYMVLADEPTAVYIGGRYDQDSVLTNRGFIYSTAVLPRTALTGEIAYGEDALSQDFYSRTEEGDAFSLGLDFETGPTVPDIGPGYYMIDSRPQLPIRWEDGKVELHHWSNRKLKNVDPRKAGTGPIIGEERRRGAELGFFGIMPRADQRVQGTGYVKENGLGGNEHIALVDPDSLYPYFTDPDNLSAGLLDEGRSYTHSEFQNEYEERIMNAGYLGYYTERMDATTPLGRVRPQSARYGNVAALFKKVPVKPASEVPLGRRNPPRYSMLRGMTKPLTSRERRLTVLDMMEPETANFVSDGVRRNVVEAISFLQQRRGGAVIDKGDPKSVQLVGRLMLAEMRQALIRSPEAVGWYGTTLAKAKRVAAILHPEISPVNPFSGAKSNSYDPASEHAWDLAMAITSNGMAVSENAKFANEQYEYWKANNGTFMERGTGDQGSGMVAAFRAYNIMKQTMTDAEVQQFLAQKMPLRDLRRHPVILATGVSVGTSESVDTEVNGSFIFGPKIGQGFYQNLRGNFDPLTMDLWFMRMFNRLTGKPFAEVSDKTLEDNAQRVTEAANSGDMTDYDRSVMESVMLAENIDMVTPANADAFAIAFDTRYQKDFKKFYDDAVKASGLDKKSEEAKEIGKAARPPSSELALASKTYRQNLSLKPQDAPRGASDRAYMRAVVEQVRAALANEGISISIADIQAVMWYAEKQLFAAVGVRPGKGGDNDYVDGAIELLRSKGMTDDEIVRALPESERDRLTSRTASQRAAARADRVAQAQGDDAAVGGAGSLPGEAIGGGQEAPARDGDRPGRGGVRYSRLSARTSISPTLGNQIANKQQDLMYARASDVIAKVISKTRVAKPDAAQQFADGLLRRFQDSMLPVGRMIQELSARGLNITDAMDTYMKEWNFHGITGDKIRVNTDLLYTPTIKAVERINVPKAKVDQLISLTNAASTKGQGYVGLAMRSTDSPKLVLANAYLYAKHAKERNVYIQKTKDKTNFTGSGMSNAEADAILQWFATVDPQSRAAIGDVETGVRKIIKDTTDKRVDGGLIAAGTQDPYQFYVPLRGITDGDTDIEDPGQTGGGTGRGFGARRREDQAALGRYDYGADVLANVLYQNQTAITRSERNKVGQSFLKLLRADEGVTSSYAEILPKAPTKRSQRANGKLVDVRDQEALRGPNFLVVKEDGKEVFVRFNDPRLSGVLNGQNAMSPGMAAPIVNAMGKINRYLASINTSYNPEFIITNMFRDLQTAGVNLSQYEMNGLTREVMKDLIPALRGIKRSIINKDDSSEWSKVFRDFAQAGGQNATNSVSTLEQQMSNIEGLLTDISESGIRGQFAKVKRSFVGKGVGSLLSTIENYNTVAENGIRIATYKALLDRGMTKERAAQAARGITVNFAKGGDMRNFMNAFYLFYNASLQGSFALLNAAARSGKVRRLWVSAVAVGLLLDQVNAAMSDEDDDGKKAYDKAPDFVLEHNLILMDPFGFTPRGYFSIPLPYGLNAAFNTGRAISRAWRGEYDAGEATSSILGTVIDMANPMGGSESFANFAAPTVVDPFIDIIENRDFADKAIYKENVSFDKTPAPDSQLYWSTTSPSAVWLTNRLNELTGGNAVRPGYMDFSPDTVQFWVELTTGGVGRFVMNAMESPLAIASSGLNEEVWRSIPFSRKLYGSVSEREDTGYYIEGAKEILMAGEELKRARETGDANWARETMQSYGRELRLYGPIKSIEASLTKISRQIKQVEKAPGVPEEQRKLIIERLKERRHRLVTRGNALMRQAG
jgi:hypothetical protein